MKLYPGLDWAELDNNQGYVRLTNSGRRDCAGRQYQITA
jgi:hypothetical protein